jgi:hypothetical protein
VKASFCLPAGCSLHRLAGRGCPAATHFSLLRQRKVSKRKATRSLGPYASLRATCGARSKRGLAKLAFGSNNASPDPLGSALLGPARTGQSGSGAGTKDKETNTNTNKDTPRRVLVDFGVRLFGIPSPHPLWMRRGAQGQTDQGWRCLSEAQRSAFSQTPAGPSTAGCPQRSGGTQQPGSPFLLLTFLLAKQKKSELPPGNPRPTALSNERTAGARAGQGGGGTTP